MPKTQHTPGPWQYQENSDAYTHIVRAGERYLCNFAQDTSGVAEANARLTAAAPDLLNALDALAKAAFMATCEDDAGLHHLDGSLIDVAWKAIRKAKGKE